MVPVIPEFKRITVGGAINGAAIESSSHLYGQFNDCCLTYVILLVQAGQSANSDLFYGIAGSYGSLGLIVSVELKLIPAKPWVGLKYYPFSSLQESLECMNRSSEKASPLNSLRVLFLLRNAFVLLRDIF